MAAIAIEVRCSLWSNIIEILWHLKILFRQAEKSLIIWSELRTRDTCDQWTMMAVWLFANCCLLSRYDLIPAQAPASLERACNLCRPDWLGQGMPGVDDTNYKTKASFHPSFRLLWPGRANTSLRKHEGELEFTRFNIFADTEWWVMGWRDIQMLFVTRG